jgi:transketolase
MSFTVARPGQTAAMNVSETQGVFIEKPFGKALIELARSRPDIVGLTADLGKYTDIDIFGQEFPNRYFQTGMAEQNLVGIAAGLAHSGFLPFATTYAVFATRRAYDFIAIDVAYARANVKIIAGLPGLTTGYGATHQGIDDLALMRAVPGMVVIDPCDATEITQAVPAIAAYQGPVYMRLLRGKVAQILDPATHRFEIGKAFSLRTGRDLTLVSTGLMTGRALQAAEALANEGLDAGVLHVPTLKPLDEQAILHAARTTGAFLTLENHTVVGGLGAAVAEILCLNGVAIRMAKVGIQDRFVECGSVDYLADKHGLSTRRIIEAARSLLGVHAEKFK